jgi:putative aldouronate transport system permease protein
MFFIALTLWFTGGMIPTFLVVKNVGLYNSLFALFVPTLVSAFHVVVMRNFFEGVPESLDESARIDGAGDFWILFKIYVPLSMPVIATVSLWLAVTYWNNFFNPLLYLADRSKYTLQVVLRDIVLSSSFVEYGMDARIDEDVEMVPEGIRNATILFSTIPILMVYPFLQRYFIKGVIVGAVKE